MVDLLLGLRLYYFGHEVFGQCTHVHNQDAAVKGGFDACFGCLFIGWSWAIA